ncbi:hypothetical protein [Aeropyrum globular virus 1]|uniref:hypothetical protein n=1 Tax=Aeropyrum globular virus 1 TaxID=1932713 RepID=UPI000C7EF496|nr:hypothetical protein C1186_gp02 [Aeropyrum globular virus 1]BBC20928.1 hypothetical protein [Aeropyrum globular virus 1]
MLPVLILLGIAVLAVALGFIDIQATFGDIDWKMVGLGAAAGFAALLLMKPGLVKKAVNRIR